ncbi:Tfp pilus assembly protein FimT/FimU [Roseateles sp.]|uniref:pilus assembly FimT family protein n=1 Tax=Roseateles sp. TaxID=1971397 RepID=UPI0025EF7CAB|nr:GspH/FimT family pseudopilin [Roseateles sp.]MBV8034331.1 GspH/FimT family pseudopilin [Roseateles sp.]
MLMRRGSGFSLIELMVAVSVLAILTAVAMPSFVTWIRNARVRTVADALQSGLRVAQGEAQRRAHTVVFFLTNSKTCDLAATVAATGGYWQVRTVPNAVLTNDVAEAVQCGVLTDVSTGINLTSAATALCFGGDGRQTTMTNPTGIGANCAAAAATYDIAPQASSTENRPLRVTVSLAGSVRMCDPGKASTAPDGCR